MAATTLNKGRNLEHPERIDGKSPEQREKGADQNSQEIKELQGAVAEGAEVFETGKVQEKTSDQKENKGSSFTSSGTATSASSSAAQVVAIPPIDVMVKEVSVAIHSQLKVLQGEVKVYKKDGKRSYKLNETIKEIRTLNSILSSLGSITLEALKALWLKLVKKVH